MFTQGSECNTGSPVGGAHASTRNLRGPAWAGRVAERFVGSGKPGNADGGEVPQFERNAGKEARIMETGASLAASDTVRTSGRRCMRKRRETRPSGATR